MAKSEFKTGTRKDSDPGLFSLSQIMHLMRVEFSRAQRYNYPIACVLLAIDRLSELRELYGYDSKEAILDETVRLLQAKTRSCDFLGRLADDKLLAILPHTSPEGVRTMAERVLRGIRELNFESDGKKLRVTASIGSSHNSGGTTMFFDTLLAAAEGALAEAAAAGGDRFAYRDPGLGGG
jgi:diguanylate cyclase (GGDEF)-like protein